MSLKKINKNNMENKINFDKHIWEGWTVQSFINELEPTFDLIMQNRSWQKPFKTKKEIKEWCINNQPYYKKYVPEVVDYFFERYNNK